MIYANQHYKVSHTETKLINGKETPYIITTCGVGFPADSVLIESNFTEREKNMIAERENYLTKRAKEMKMEKERVKEACND
jgi:hypothetical protein